MAALVAPVHIDMVSSLLDVLAIYAGDARLTAWEKKVSMRHAQDTSHVEADESLQMILLLLEELACILQICFHYTTYVHSFFQTPPPSSQPLVVKVSWPVSIALV